MTRPTGPHFDNTYITLPERFYSAQLPTPVPAPRLIRANRALAEQLGIDPDWLESESALDVLAGNRIPEGAEPIATVYAGHQFGGWNPRLGDGRAVLLGEVVGRDGRRYDIQLKGAGPTPYSRMGDGRSPLGPVLREYIVSEAMAALGVPTTRSLAAVATGERVVRDALLPGGVLTRVAASHIRIGTFQYFSARGDVDAVRLLAEHVIARHYPEIRRPELPGATQPYLALLQAVIARQAQLVAKWQQLGFIHGVMNTDNMLLSGETIDYGPCAFMDNYHPATVYSSIDTQGRYAFGNQPAIAQWNLSWLAQALLPLLDADEKKAVALAQDALSGFAAAYRAAYDIGMLNKLGLTHVTEENRTLLQDLLTAMTQAGADYTLTLRHLAELADPEAGTGIAAHFTLPADFDAWLARWRTALAAEPVAAADRRRAMLAVNPVFIPRNHLVEEAIAAAVDNDDFAPFHRLVDVLTDPFGSDPAPPDPGLARYTLPPRPEQVVTRTFCGT